MLGAFIGIEFVTDLESIRPAPEFHRVVHEESVRRGVLGVTQFGKWVYRMQPALNMPLDLFEWCCETVADVIRDVAVRPAHRARQHPRPGRARGRHPSTVSRWPRRSDLRDAFPVTPDHAPRINGPLPGPRSREELEAQAAVFYAGQTHGALPVRRRTQVAAGSWRTSTATCFVDLVSSSASVPFGAGRADLVEAATRAAARLRQRGQPRQSPTR